jgi:hypothetical protein
MNTARLVCAFAVVLAGAIHANALRNPFIYDDYRVIVENRAMTGPMSLPVLLGVDATRPVATLSYALDRVVWGSGPFGFHLTNVLLHMLSVGLFALFVWRAADDGRHATPPGPGSTAHIIAPVAALLLAVHPLTSTAVGYISGRPEVLCAVFVFLALLSARRWMLGHGARWLAATIVCWIAALAAKETAIVFPLMVLAYDNWILRGRHLWRHAPLLTLAIVLGVVRVLVLILIENGGALDAQWSLAFVELDVVRRYFTMLVVPAGQAIFHSIAPLDGSLHPRALGGVAFVAVWVALVWTQRRRRPLVSFGLGWFLAFLLPSAVLVMLDRGEPMADHRVYLAGCGVFLLTGLLADRIWQAMAGAQRATRVVLVAGFAAVLAAFGGRTLVRNALWSNPVLVWLDAAERAPNDWLPNRVLGEELHRANRHDEAIAAFRRALALAPDQVSTYGKLGVCLSEQGDLAGAEAAFSTLRRFDAASTEASNGLATIALLHGRIAAARAGYLQTLAIDPSNVPARRGLIVIEEGPGGNAAEALRWCRDIKRLEPESPGVDECIRKHESGIGTGRDRER